MSEQQSAPDLRPLDEHYQIVGELRGAPPTRYFIARRKDDGSDVMIAVVDAAAAGENNALAHFASDAQLLSSETHPSIARVIEGRWLGKDAFAVVTERIRGSTLHELLSADGPFPNPRIATVLQEVAAAIAWARERGVVHRGVTPESLYFDQETKRVRFPLGLTAIPLEGLPDAAADARTIGSLAWAMLTGHSRESADEKLSDVRADLAQRVVEETTAILNARLGETPDVDRYLSVVAMGDVLREGELEIARMQAELLEERREERVKFEAQAREAADKAAGLMEKLKQEREAFEQRIEEEDRRVASERAEAAVERAQLELERNELADQMAEFKLRAEIERPTEVPMVMPALVTDRDNDPLVVSRNRFGWLIPVGAVALLLLLIVFGTLVVKHRPTHAGPVVIGKSRVEPVVTSPKSGLPRGGFLTQPTAAGAARVNRSPLIDSAGGRVSTAGDSTIRRDSVARPDSLLRRDSLARRDSIARRDSLARRDTTRPPP